MSDYSIVIPVDADDFDPNVIIPVMKDVNVAHVESVRLVRNELDGETVEGIEIALVINGTDRDE